MVKYYLGIKKDGKWYQIKEGSLIDIDKFTSSFSNEEALITYLYHNGLINSNLLTGKISIIYNKEKILKNGIMYSNDKDYINFDYLLAQIITCAIDYQIIENKILLRRLFNHFYHSYDKTRLNILYQYLNKDNLNKNELNHFIKTLEDFCYYLICSNGKINYLYLRDLAMYYSHLINYQPKNKTLKKELEGQLTFF